MKIIKAILWFLMHKSNEYVFEKKYIKDLNYYEYKLYVDYKVLCLIRFKWLLDKFEGHELLTFHNIAYKLPSSFSILETTETI